MKIKSIKNLIRSNVEQFGLAKTLYDILLRTINRVTFLKVFQAVTIDTINPDFLGEDSQLEWQFFTKAQLEDLAENQDHDISESFLQAALEKGDECYGVLDGHVLASYGWYSNKPTETSDDLTVHFSPEYIYMYKGFTHPKYRGKRLHAIGMNRALRDYLDRRYKGLVSYVESNNFSSLKSSYRLGFKDFGRVVVLKVGQHLMIHANRGCRKYGFFLRKSPLQPEPATHLEMIGELAGHAVRN